ncbi:MAG: hypothetical protein ACTHJ0_15280 [Flavipsychrobacter sp.]
MTKNIGVLAERKGMPPGRWKLYTVLGWIFFELTGFFISAMIVQNLLANAFFGMVCAFTGYLIPKYLLEKMPNKDTHWTDGLGSNS